MSLANLFSQPLSPTLVLRFIVVLASEPASPAGR